MSTDEDEEEPEVEDEGKTLDTKTNAILCHIATKYKVFIEHLNFLH